MFWASKMEIKVFLKDDLAKPTLNGLRSFLAISSH